MLALWPGLLCGTVYGRIPGRRGGRRAVQVLVFGTELADLAYHPRHHDAPPRRVRSFLRGNGLFRVGKTGLTRNARMRTMRYSKSENGFVKLYEKQNKFIRKKELTSPPTSVGSLMPHHVPARGSSSRGSRNARIGPELTTEDTSNERAVESGQIEALTLKLNSESIQTAKVGDEEFEMLMLDGYSHYFVLILISQFSYGCLQCTYSRFFFLVKCCGTGRGSHAG